MEPRKSYNDGLCEMLRKMVGKTVFSTATRTIASEWSLCVTIGDAPPWLRADNWMLPIHAADAIERLAGDLELLTREVEHLRAERDEARREVCAIYADTYGSVGLVAERRGWNCFKEASDGRG